MEEGRKPRASEVKQGITGRADPLDIRRQENEARTTQEEAAEHIAGLKAFYAMRQDWSKFLMTCIAYSVLFQFALAIAVGLDKVHFEKYKWFLPLIVSTNFIQILALAAIVICWLFSGVRPEKALHELSAMSTGNVTKRAARSAQAPVHRNEP